MRHTAITLLLCLTCLPLMASTNLTYQGRLDASGTPFSGTVAMQFQLYDSETGGNPVGPPLDHSSVEVTDGLFQVDLDFGHVFDGPRWLQISVDGSELSSRQRVAPTPTAIRADTLDGLDSTAFQQAFTRTLVVSPTGNATADGTTLLDTISGINDATQSSPVQVVIEPGTYTLDQTLNVPSNVFIRGAGRGVTRITRTGDIDTSSFDAVSMSGPSALVDLSVLAFGGGSDYVYAVDIGDGGEVRLNSVRVRVQGGNLLNYAVNAASSGNAQLRVNDSSVEADGGSRAYGIVTGGGMGLSVRASTVVAAGATSVMVGVQARGTPDSRLVNSQIESGEDGIFSDNGLLTVRNSEIFAQYTGASGQVSIFDSRVEAVNGRVITATTSSTITEVANSQLIGSSGLGSCVAVYDGNFNFYPETCPTTW